MCFVGNVDKIILLQEMITNIPWSLEKMLVKCEQW